MAAADPIDGDELVRQLTALGVASGDVVTVHASLRRLGPVVGGASTVIDAPDRAVGPQGTIMMVPGAEDAIRRVRSPRLRVPLPREPGALFHLGGGKVRPL